MFLEGHETRNQKFDPLFGVTAMRPMFQEQKISLPYLGYEAQEKGALIYKSVGLFQFCKNKK